MGQRAENKTGRARNCGGTGVTKHASKRAFAFFLGKVFAYRCADSRRWKIHGSKIAAVAGHCRAISAGADFPDGAKNTLGPRSVLLLSSEDDPATTIRPRAELAGANLAKLYNVKMKVTRDGVK